MNIQKFTKVGVTIALVAAMAGCSSWDSMSSRQKSTTAGAGLGVWRVQW